MPAIAYRRFHRACLIALLTLAPVAAARADFFDDARRTFEVDIPHFFQDDVPCAFGGKPTSGTKTSCKSSDHPKKSDDKAHDQPTPPPEKPKAGGDDAAPKQ